MPHGQLCNLQRKHPLDPEAATAAAAAATATVWMAPEPSQGKEAASHKQPMRGVQRLQHKDSQTPAPLPSLFLLHIRPVLFGGSIFSLSGGWVPLLSRSACWKFALGILSSWVAYETLPAGSQGAACECM